MSSGRTGRSFSSHVLTNCEIAISRSEGYGSLQVWLKYRREGISIQDSYTPSEKCAKSEWTGAAVTISGGYLWRDVYDLVFPKNLTVVGGGDPVSPQLHLVYPPGNISQRIRRRQLDVSEATSKVVATLQQVGTMALQRTRSSRLRFSWPMERSLQQAHAKMPISTLPFVGVAAAPMVSRSQ